MTRPLPWTKLWGRDIHDPGLLDLTLAERGIWWSLQALAGECDSDGAFLNGDHPMTLAQVGRSLHLDPEAQVVLETLVPKMVEKNRLGWDASTLSIVGWDEAQYIPWSYTPEGIRERKERSRQRQAAPPKSEKRKNQRETPPHPTPPPRGRGRGRVERSENVLRRDPSKGADPRDYTRGKYGHLVKY